MTQFVRQFDDYSCGPIAIFNALQSLVGECRYYRWIHRDCDPHPEYGTMYTPFNHTLHKWVSPYADIEYYRQPDYMTVRNMITNGWIAIVVEHWEEKQESGEHYYTIHGMNPDGNYIVTNAEKTHSSVSIKTPRQLRTSLLPYTIDSISRHGETIDDLLYPCVWAIRSNNLE